MIKHIVFFGLAENAEGKSKAENAQIIKSGLEVGINYPSAPKTSFDIALYTEFDSFEAVDIYQEHPAHKKVAAYIGKVKVSRAAVDYEV